ncbi:exodeoxyribonuclease III [Auritidibacter sp. NML100628]|uniref:exodeoxyribonuclease III n=1 Tax=Auritidibacter sp. NML100628 TaxID=2170742 RepID=UPI000D73B501|nr:exodeoxyribonuclease III [Auritidibacter sp. NML100628]PXA76657.1 exodeoxyribonuclease III [Auritidibacter sp. NML100628]
MKLATWNVNSLRARADRVEDFLERSDTDVLAIQETKCKDENFPWEVFERLGYAVAHFGFNQWNGVAIASRVGLTDVQRTFPGQPAFGKGGHDPVQEARAISAVVGEDLRVWSLYVPNGRALDDEHMAYKLDWLDALREHIGAELAENPQQKLALVGDWNIAPYDQDVWDIEFFYENEMTHVSAPERERFHAFEEILHDPVRDQHEQAFTYWDYQKLRFPKNEGMRIDFALVSPAVSTGETMIDRDERKGKGPSDHVPVIVEVCS